MIDRLRGKLVTQQRRKDESNKKLEAMEAKMKELQEQMQALQDEGRKEMMGYAKIEAAISILNDWIKEEQDESSEEVSTSVDKAS